MLPASIILLLLSWPKLFVPMVHASARRWCYVSVLPLVIQLRRFLPLLASHRYDIGLLSFLSLLRRRSNAGSDRIKKRALVPTFGCTYCAATLCFFSWQLVGQLSENLSFHSDAVWRCNGQQLVGSIRYTPPYVLHFHCNGRWYALLSLRNAMATHLSLYVSIILLPCMIVGFCLLPLSTFLGP